MDRPTSIPTKNPFRSGELAVEETPLALPRLSYAFARRQGVLTGEADSEGRCEVFYRPDASIESLVELRRYLGRELAAMPVDEDEFGRRLRQSYESGGGAAETMDDLGEDLDLGQVASQLAEPEDLLESDDDAPIIRMVNRTFAQANRDGASDIHIEPFERYEIGRAHV